MKQKHRLLGVLGAASAVIIVVFFVIEFFSVGGTEFTTQVVYEETVAQAVDSQMYILRNETVLDAPDSGVSIQLAENSERVSNGSSIAAVFNDETQADNYLQLCSLKEKLAVYQKLDSQLKLANIDLDKLHAEVDSEFYAILDSVYSNDFSEISEHKLSFSETLSREQISFGETVDCSAKITEIQSQISALEASSVPSRVITSQASGFYVGELDGYEGVLTADDVDKLTPEMLDKAFNAQKSEPSQTHIGKIISGYTWYVATVIDSGYLSEIEKGEPMTLILGETENEKIETTVYSISSAGDNKSLVVFACRNMNESIASLRKVSGKVIINEYTGLKVNKDAVRFDANGNPGVYVRRGNIVNFRSLNLLYTGDNFVVAADNPEVDLPATHLKLYDEVIVSGKDLKDGMVIG